MPANNINHLAAYNGIIDAISALDPVDLTGIETSINALSAKIDLVIAAMANGGANGGGTSTTTGTGHAVIGNDTDLMCAIASCLCQIAVKQGQMTKMMAFLTQDGPNISLDSPIMAYPDPLDSDPPSIFTPKPITTTTPNTFSLPDGWLPPPGGLNGATDNATFMLYKCDSAEYIIRAIVGYYQAMGSVSFISSTGAALSVAAAYDLLYQAFLALSIEPIFGGTASYHVAVFVTSQVVLNAIAVIIIDLIALGAITALAFGQMIQLIDQFHDEFVCALYRAKSISEARDKFIEVMDAHADTPLEWIFGQYGNGHILILKYLLTDDLLSLLFACPADFDPAEITGIGDGMCDTCVYCKDTTGSITVEKSSKSNYNALTDIGYEPYPLTIDLGTMDVSLICVDGETNWVNGSGRVEVFVDGVLEATGTWGAQLTRQAVLVRPVAPETAFAGGIVVKMYHAGSTVKGVLTIHEIAWVDTGAV